MEKIGKLFDEYLIILYYDKSTDDTLHILKRYQIKNYRLYFYVNTAQTSPYRTYNIAKGRNYCVQTIIKNLPDYDYFIMMDCDDICARDINPVLLNEYLKRNDWDSLSFQHPLGYYDLWALSKRPFIFSCHNFNDPIMWQRFITNKINKCKKHELIPCYSAFNGFAIYRTNKFINCYYDGRFRYDYIPNIFLRENIAYAGRIQNKKSSMEDCEHRHFHFQAIQKNGARIRISPLCLFV